MNFLASRKEVYYILLWFVSICGNVPNNYNSDYV